MKRLSDNAKTGTVGYGTGVEPHETDAPCPASTDEHARQSSQSELRNPSPGFAEYCRALEAYRLECIAAGNEAILRALEGSDIDRVLVSVREGAVEVQTFRDEFLGRYPDTEKGRAELARLLRAIDGALVMWSSSVDFCDEDGLEPRGRAHEILHEARTGRQETLEEIARQVAVPHPPWRYSRGDAEAAGRFPAVAEEECPDEAEVSHGE